MSPADILARYIVQVGVGNNPPGNPWPTYYSILPDAPDQALCAFNTAGILDGRLQEDGLTIEHHGVQVMVRSKQEDVGWTKAKAVKTMLNAIRNNVVTEASATINAATLKTPIIPLGIEAGTKRYRFTINAILTITEG